MLGTTWFLVFTLLVANSGLCEDAVPSLEHLKCKICEDVAVDDIDFIDGELIIHQNFVINLCKKIVSSVNPGLGMVACEIALKARTYNQLKRILAQLKNQQIELKQADALCKYLHFCGPPATASTRQ
ncbi:hypothetical protein ANCCAN_06829 [Ancylostoma caninum]|uniref:Saposin B-type domain-containing protein n=1 Tax=Ancylostoma caninum TaxID=29170 RepID=A0A368GRW1_ANCCA|nr:hypothetical protein ANCCAN_06829 [Ancylostoma caninum]